MVSSGLMVAALPRGARSQRHDRCTPAHGSRVHALDLASDHGPRASFLEAQRSLDHSRGRWYPTRIDRLSRPAWPARGGASLGERAAARVATILSSHHAPPLPEAADVAITGVLEPTARTPRAEPIP